MPLYRQGGEHKEGWKLLQKKEAQHKRTEKWNKHTNEELKWHIGKIIRQFCFPVQKDERD